MAGFSAFGPPILGVFQIVEVKEALAEFVEGFRACGFQSLLKPLSD